MKTRQFNSIMHFLHEKWAAEVLGMKVNAGDGPDLISEDKIMEVKFTLGRDWTVLEHQMNYNNGKVGYWGLGIYSLREDIDRIKIVSSAKLEKLVEKRQLFIVPWEWMYQFPPHYTKGKTKNSEWENTLRYPKLKNLPQTIATYELKKGLVYLTEGVSFDAFSIKGKFLFNAESH
jgi:hypothetical protein